LSDILDPVSQAPIPNNVQRNARIACAGHFSEVRHFSEVPSIAPVLIFLAAQTIERRWGESDQN